MPAESKLTVAELLVRGQQNQQAGQLTQAEQCYEEILKREPRNVSALHQLGEVFQSQGKFAVAVECFRAALAQDAQRHEIHFSLGVTLAGLRQWQEAAGSFRRAIQLCPTNAQAHNNLGVALGGMKQHDEALASHREAVRLQPDYVEAHFNMGVCASDQGKTQDAITSYEKVLSLRPDHLGANYNLGLLLVKARRPAESAACLQHVLRLKPDYAEAHNNLTLALADLGRFEDAVAACNQALKLRPEHAASHMNRGSALSDMGRTEEALACFAQALCFQPDYPNAHWNRALAWLTQGDYERGWPEYEWRWKRQETKAREFPFPWWNGSSLDGKKILLWCEQGIGDTLQFIRYANVLKKRGATVWLECPLYLQSLLATCAGIDRVLKPGELDQPCDFHAPLMSLPALCGTALTSIPAEVPYLSTGHEQAAHWRKVLKSSHGIKIGIAWQGNPDHAGDRHRSFPAHWFGSLAHMPGVELFSLQQGAGVEQLDTASFPVTNLRPQLDELGGTLHETGALMQALDLVVCCDSAVAHLAGALGVPVWVAMSAHSDWRWLRDRVETPWYPSMRLFRQPKLGAWRSVFDKLRQEVANLQKFRGAVGRTATFSAGAMPLDSTPPSTKLMDWPALLTICSAARDAGKKVVWTNGCFDLLHVGHIRNLQAARNLGDLLVVGVNSDRSIQRLKGAGRPILPEAERVEILSSVGAVDCIIVFDEDTPSSAIARLKPDIHCKGADYAPPDGKPIPEASIIEGYGGRIEFLSLVPGTSTSDLIERIRKG